MATGPEVGIVMLLQLLLSPLWVWLAFGEAPPTWTIVGGLLLLVTLMGHELAMHRLQATKSSDEITRAASLGPVLHTTQADSVDDEHEAAIGSAQQV